MCSTCWASYVIFCVRLCYVLSRCVKDFCQFLGILTNNIWDLSFSRILWVPKKYERFLWSFRTHLNAIKPHSDVRISGNSSLKRVGWMKTVRLPLSDCTASALWDLVVIWHCTASAKIAQEDQKPPKQVLVTKYQRQSWSIAIGGLFGFFNQII